MQVNQFNERRTERAARPDWPAHENDACGLAGSCEDELPEVFVLSQQDAPFRPGQVNDSGVFGTAGSLGNRDHIMPCRSQRPHSGEVAALVRQESHASEA